LFAMGMESGTAKARKRGEHLLAPDLLSRCTYSLHQYGRKIKWERLTIR